MATKKGGDDKFTKKMSSSEEAKFRKEYKVPADKNIVISDKNLSDWRANKTGTGFGYSTSDKPKPSPKPEITATLKTKKLSTSTKTPDRERSTTKTSEESKPKFTPEAKSKKLTKGGRTGNLGTTVKNVVGKQVFKSEQKKSDAYNRATSGTGTGSLAGASKMDRARALKDRKSELKSVKKDVKKSTGVSLRSEIKDTKKAIKWSNKVGENKNKYLTISGKKK